MTDRNDGARTALQALFDREGQSPWIDFIDRDLHESGKLDELIGKGIRGLTSNPTIFGKAVATGQYDDLIRREIEAGDDNQQIYEEIAVGDIQAACDHLRSVYDASGGTDGFASIEVEPAWADDTDGTIERARHLWARVDRPNCFVKIPATEAGIPAVEQAISEGINVNVTLMFSVAVYERIARAYLAGLRRRLAGGGDLRRLSSVASFFVSRVDTEADRRLVEAGRTDLQGKLAVANAKLAYEHWQQAFSGDRWAFLEGNGARNQRCL